MKNTRANLVVWLVLALAMTLAGCGTDGDVSTETDPDDDVILQVEDLSGPISEQNLRAARHVFDEGTLRWESFDPFAHIMTAGLAGISEVRVEFDAEGNVVSEEVVLGEPDDPAVELLPRSVDEVFAELDALIAAFETGERAVPDEGECGAHFNARFNTDLGVPEYYDSLGPCEDGVGISINVSRVE